MAESEHNVTININGNASSAVGAFGRVVNSIKGVRSAISNVMNAFGVFGLAVNGVNMLINGYKWLKEKLEEASKAAAKMRLDMQMRAAATETNRLVSSHERLAKLLKDELDTLAKQKAVGGITKQGDRDLEDGRREAERARKIYEAKTPEEEQALRDQFDREDEEIERKRKKQDRQERIKELDEEESAYTSKAKGLSEKQKSIDQQIKEEELNVKRARGSRKDGEAMSEEEKSARDRVAALKKAKEANDLAIEVWEKEAKYRRDQIAALEGVKDYEGESAASIQAKQREKEKARENEKSTNEADSDWREKRRRDDEKKAFEDKLDGTEKNEDKKKALDDEAKKNRDKASDLRREYESEMAKDASKRDAEYLAELRRKIDELESSADSYEKRGKDIKKEENLKRADKIESFADRIDSADAVSQNRLTAMGLGSGVSAKGDVSSELRKIVDLLREDVKANNENKQQSPTSNVAVYGE